jgi:hypothetical protein
MKLLAVRFGSTMTSCSVRIGIVRPFISFFFFISEDRSGGEPSSGITVQEYMKCVQFSWTLDPSRIGGNRRPRLGAQDFAAESRHICEMAILGWIFKSADQFDALAREQPRRDFTDGALRIGSALP